MNKLSVVGIGPGAEGEMTLRAMRALTDAQVIVGYGVYNDLIRPLFPDKEFLETPMRRETERCRMAIEAAEAGKRVAMICSGDAGVYGMAGLILEMAKEKNVEVEIVPGVTAALSGAARLGAPLGHDFAVISLSDLLTPWEKIETRLELAAQADLCVAIYNPSSTKRADYLQRACDILLRHRAPETVCGAVKNIAREGEEKAVMTLIELRSYKADMFTTVFIGNSQTKLVDGWMVTPRGYKNVNEKT